LTVFCDWSFWAPAGDWEPVFVELNSKLRAPGQAARGCHFMNLIS